ncbi:splicing factor [Coemansia asiatica]|uniref:Splicing factor n=1 Tax=Coemansia asiatica TaxID=1052880 RepID=A0A9W7XDG8_9FUNG|nr:splicing factor [Coemansia asiatica]
MGNGIHIDTKQKDASMLAEARSATTAGPPREPDLIEGPTERHRSTSASTSQRQRSPLHKGRSRSPSAYRRSSSRRNHNHNHNHNHSRSRSRSQGGRHERGRGHSYTRSRSHSRSVSVSRRRSRSSSRSRNRNRNRNKSGSLSRSRSHRRSSRSRCASARSLSPEVDESERDMRTVFAMQLSSRLRRGDLVDFFSSVGRVRDAKIVAEKGSRRSRGVAYVEFYSIDSAVEAVKLSGQKLLGVPIIVQPSDAQKNRQSTVKQYSADGAPVGSANNTLVYVHGIMVDMEPEDLSEFFDLFGRVDYCHLFSVEADEWAAFVKFDMPAAAQAAVKKLNGLELFGARLQVRTARKSEQEREAQRTADQEMQMDATDQTKQDKDKALKQKSPPLLTNNKIPANHDSQIAAVTIGDEAAYRVLRLFNMFDPREEPGNSDDWIRDIEQDVSGECSGFGQVDGVRVEPKSATGSVLVQFADKVAARSAYLAMNQRWFGGRKIDAALVPDDIWAGQHVS